MVSAMAVLQSTDRGIGRDAIARRLALRPAAWINRPNGYYAVGLTALLDTSERVLEGRITDSACGAVRLVRLKGKTSSLRTRGPDRGLRGCEQAKSLDRGGSLGLDRHSN